MLTTFLIFLFVVFVCFFISSRIGNIRSDAVWVSFWESNASEGVSGAKRATEHWIQLDFGGPSPAAVTAVVVYFDVRADAGFLPNIVSLTRAQTPQDMRATTAHALGGYSSERMAIVRLGERLNAARAGQDASLGVVRLAAADDAPFRARHLRVHLDGNTEAKRYDVRVRAIKYVRSRTLTERHPIALVCNVLLVVISSPS
jgi:hypothetical protein